MVKPGPSDQIEQSTKPSPMISVVMATYNGEKYIEEQLNSVLEQSYKNLEIIIVDDCSTDSTIAILNKYVAAHKNIRLFRNENNLGFIKNFDKGCGLSTGEYIALCDQDDYWDKYKIEKLYNKIGKSSMVYSDSFLCDDKLNKSGKKVSDKVNCITITYCLQHAVFCRIYGHATLMSRAVYEKATPFLTDIPHDWWLCFIASTLGNVTYLDEPLCYYRQHTLNLIGIAGGKKRNIHKQNKKPNEKEKIRRRVQAFYNICPDRLVKEKRVLSRLIETYKDFSLVNDFKRVILFFKYYKYFLAPKKRSLVSKYLFCLKMFVKIK
jgi:glycosyltransferase involved in cell wall biosynthesis